MSERTYNVLVTGVGAIIGYGIINGLRQSGLPLRIYGTDIYLDAYGRSLCDHFVPGVRALSDDYLPFIQHTIEENQIDLIIPGIEQDLYSLWEKKEQIPTSVVMNNDLTVKLSRDKLQTYQYFRGLNESYAIPTLHSVSYRECVDEFGLPFVLKPVSSYASKGVALIHSVEDFDFYSAKVNHRCVYQKYMGDDDHEFTVGVFGDGSGGYFDSIVLKRRLSKEGATSKACLVESDPGITDCINSMCRHLKPVGPTNIQLRKEDGSVYLLEVNPRISSSCSIRAALGYNEPEMCVKYFLLHEPIVSRPKRKGSAVRYIADCIHYEE